MAGVGAHRDPSEQAPALREEISVFLESAVRHQSLLIISPVTSIADATPPKASKRTLKCLGLVVLQVLEAPPGIERPRALMHRLTGAALRCRPTRSPDRTASLPVHRARSG